MYNFAFKISNIIIEELIWMWKDYFPLKKKFEIQKNNAFNKFNFYSNFLSYRFIPNLKYENFVFENWFLIVSAIKEFIFGK